MPAVLVTGAGRGIGRAVALRMATAGWDVIAGVRDGAAGEALRAESDRIAPVTLDLASADHLAGLPAALPERLDAIVNNAGVVVSGPVEAVGVEEVRRQFEINVVAQVAVTQAVLPRIRAAGGRILFVSSVSGRVSTPFTGVYSASKFAIEGIADAMRVELRPWRIPVVLIEPGSTDTDIWRNALDTADATEAAMKPEHRDLYADQAAGIRKTVKRIQRQTIPVEKVTDAVHAALTADRPRARYLIGTDSRIQVALRSALPTRAFDAALARLTGGR
jgi:NAD(P)-dependent dehydrogenase (short-subunit alcohol dehydrogenase family)